MSIIREKKKQPFKIQFYLTKEIEDVYKENKKLAKEAGVIIDFKEDFLKWFLKENKKVNAELTKRVPNKPKAKPKKKDGKTDPS